MIKGAGLTSSKSNVFSIVSKYLYGEEYMFVSGDADKLDIFEMNSFDPAKPRGEIHLPKTSITKIRTLEITLSE